VTIVLDIGLKAGKTWRRNNLGSYPAALGAFTDADYISGLKIEGS